MHKDSIDYGKLVDEAMHVIVFKVLKAVETNGLPGVHHFFISFVTKHKGVKLSTALCNKYPREMTIVLQYQYEDLKVDSHGFAITLSFGGVKEQIYIPYAAITTFADPSVQFGLQFREVDYDFENIEDEDGKEDIDSSAPLLKGKKREVTGVSNVISFDKLRKHHHNNH